jgi:hypothetical protein
MIAGLVLLPLSGVIKNSLSSAGAGLVFLPLVNLPTVAFAILKYVYLKYLDSLCGLVVRVPGYRAEDPAFDSQRYQFF